jgi:hypothetical protein
MSLTVPKGYTYMIFGYLHSSSTTCTAWLNGNDDQDDGLYAKIGNDGSFIKIHTIPGSGTYTYTLQNLTGSSKYISGSTVLIAIRFLPYS